MKKRPEQDWDGGDCGGEGEGVLVSRVRPQAMGIRESSVIGGSSLLVPFSKDVRMPGKYGNKNGSKKHKTLE